MRRRRLADLDISTPLHETVLYVEVTLLYMPYSEVTVLDMEYFSEYGTCKTVTVDASEQARRPRYQHPPARGDRLRVGVPREQKMLKGHLPRVIYHRDTRGRGGGAYA